MKEDSSRRAPHPGAGRAAAAEFPDDREAQGVVALRLLAGRQRKGIDPFEKPGEIVLPAEALAKAGRAQIIPVRDIRVFERFLREERKKGRQEGAQAVVRLVSLPVDRDAPAEATLEPPHDVVGVVGRDRRAGDPRDLRVIEGREVRAGRC